MANQEMYKHDAMLHIVWALANADREHDWDWENGQLLKKITTQMLLEKPKT